MAQMQVPKSEQQTALRSDDCINFRPSPNFKHMKKYLKSKFEEMQSAASQSIEEKPSPKEETDVTKVVTAIHPPLPPNPPPPDSPLCKVKQEIEDEDYNYNNTTDFSNHSAESIKVKIDESISEEPEPNMCRNFVRGNCKKGSSCIFAHKIIKSQLHEVYTFCNNFQNNKCLLPKCKYVHATVFEKENFLRTGYLPPHALAHTKPTMAVPPPPPPPPPEETTSTMFAPPFDSRVAPPPVIGYATNMSCSTNIEFATNSNYPSGSGQITNTNYSTTSSFATDSSFRAAFPPPPIASNGPENVYRVKLPDSTSSNKREWTDTDDFSRSSCDLFYEPMAKKCKGCDENEIRYNFHENKVENLFITVEKYKLKNKVLVEKQLKLSSVLSTVFKQSTGNDSGSSSSLGSTLNLGGDQMQNLVNILLENMLHVNNVGISEERKQNLLSNLNF